MPPGQHTSDGEPDERQRECGIQPDVRRAKVGLMNVNAESDEAWNRWQGLVIVVTLNCTARRVGKQRAVLRRLDVRVRDEQRRVGPWGEPHIQRAMNSGCASC